MRAFAARRPRRVSFRPVADTLESRLLMAVQPVISEFMADNKSVKADPDGVFSDWIELYNPDPAAQNVGGYYLTDDATQLTKWQIPANTTIPANGYLLVWANSTTTPVPGRLYANFALSKEGEYLALVQPNGTTINTQFSPSFPAQAENKSYGLAGNNVSSPVYGKLASPTPGIANPSSVQVADVQFGTQRGFFTNSFNLTLTSPTAGATIRYTLDGNTPTSSSSQYSGPITINKTTVVRAIAFKSGSTSSVVVAQTYVFVDDVIRQPKNLRNQFNLANKKISSDGAAVAQDTAMDQSVVNGNESAVKAGLQSIPTLSLSTDFSKMFGGSGVYDEPEGGSRPEQPVSVELIDPAHPEDNGGVYGIVEGQSHDRMKRSLRLSFKADNGGPTKWETDLLKNAPLNGATASGELDNLVLRAGNNRNWARDNGPTAYTEDEWYRATQVAVSGEGSHGTFVHLYINGAYWGLYNIVERPDEKRYAEANGGDDEQTFAIDHDGDIKGNPARWNTLMNSVVNKNMSSSSNWNELQQYVDMKQFTEYLTIAWYQGTTDWPDNNWWAAGPNNGKVRFYAWDGEKSWDRNDIVSNGAYIEPQFKSSSSSEPIVRIFRAALGSNEFKIMLADTVYRLTANGGALSDSAAQARWDALTNFVSTAIWGESARWGDAAKSESNKTYTRSGDFLPEVSKIRGQMSGNAADLIGLLRGQSWYPSVNPPTFSQRGGNVDPGYAFTLSPPSGSNIKVYYTTDGSDPRLPGGGVSAVAKLYSGAVTINATANVVIRALSGSSTWSAKDAVTFTIDPFSKLRVVELNYNPAPFAGVSDAQNMEFVEIQNTGNTAVNLNGVSIEGAAYTFGNVSLAPGAFTVVTKNLAAFATRYPSAPTPAGQFASGTLDNGGETIRLLNPTGGVIHEFRYEDGSTPEEIAAGWIANTDGGGSTLMIKNPGAATSTWNTGTSWRASDFAGGTPGASNAVPVNQAPVVTASTTTPTITIGDAAALVGSATDDGLPALSTVTLTWSKNSGPGAVSFGNANAGNTTATFSAAGTYVLRLSATDGALTGFKDVTVVVQLANQPPVLTVNAPASVAISRSANLVATATDDNLPTPGTTRPVTWSKVSGPGDVTFSAGPNASTTLATFSALGEYVLEASATDGVFNVARQVTIIVTEAPPPNTAPEVTASVQTTPITLPSTASISAVVTDDGQPNAAPTLTWSKFSGPGNVTFGNANAANTTASFTAAGTYVLRATAFDGELSGTSDVTVVVNPAPVANAIIRFELFDAATQAFIGILNSGDTLNNATLPAKVNVRAVEASTTVKSVKFAFNAAAGGSVNNSFRTDTSTQFTLYAQSGGTGGTKFTTGSHTLKATPYATTNATGTAGQALQIQFTVINVANPVPPSAAPTALSAGLPTSNSIRLDWVDNANNESGYEVEISTDGTAFSLLTTTAANATGYTAAGLQSDRQYWFRVRATNAFGKSDYTNTADARTLVAPAAPTVLRFVLVNATTDQDVVELTDGMTLRRSDYPGLSSFSVRAETNDLANSLIFGYQSNNSFRKENGKPFALFGNTGNNYTGTSLRAGTMKISARAFASTNYTGTAGPTVTVNITVI